MKQEDKLRIAVGRRSDGDKSTEPAKIAAGKSYRATGRLVLSRALIENSADEPTRNLVVTRWGATVPYGTNIGHM